MLMLTTTTTIVIILTWGRSRGGTRCPWRPAAEARRTTASRSSPNFWVTIQEWSEHMQGTSSSGYVMLRPSSSCGVVLSRVNNATREGGILRRKKLETAGQRATTTATTTTARRRSTCQVEINQKTKAPTWRKRNTINSLQLRGKAVKSWQKKRRYVNQST